jgi:hypothetical protein
VPKLTIPERYQKGILQLISLDNRSVSGISGALSETEGALSGLKLVSAVQPLVKKLSKSDLAEMLQALRALYDVRSNSEVPTSQFVEDVLTAVQEIQQETWNGEELAAAREKLRSLLSIESIRLYSNAKSAQWDDERTFCKAKIITELRPVFSDELENGPKAMVILHRLKLGYHQNRGKHQDFYVSLDTEDLEALKDAIARAEVKSASLQMHVDKVRYLGT